MTIQAKKKPTPNLKKPTKAELAALSKGMQVMASLNASRTEFFRKAGLQYGGERDLFQALGYPQSSQLKYEDYFNRYDRQAIAAAIIDRPVAATWRGGVDIVESDDDKDTALETAWDELYKRLSLQSKFTRLDKLTGIGEYGVLLLGLSDVNTKEDFKEPVKIGKLKLNYVKPLGQNSAVIKNFEENPANERFGQPLIYEITTSDPNTQASAQLQVHWTRIIHVADALLESEIYGTPRLKPVLNRLYDIEKLTGGSAEMFWRGGRPGYQGITGDDFQMTTQMQNTLQDQIDEYEHNLRRIFMLEGIDMKPLAMQIADPSNHLDIQIQMISAKTGIPKRKLTGSERGELASSQDDDAWNELIQARREEFAAVLIVVAFVDRMIFYGVLPAPKEEYSVVWVDLWAPSEKERAEIGKIIAESLAFYTRNIESMAVIPPEAFLKHVLGLSEDKVDLILEELKNQVTIENKDFEGGEDE